MTGATYYQSVVDAVWVNTRHKPFGDPRVRRAMHLALDRHALIDVVKEAAPYLLGGFVYPFSEWATPRNEMIQRLGYQQDPKPAVEEARRLMAAAGYAAGLRNVDFVVREGTSWKLWAVAIQAMLKEALDIETKLRTVQISAFFEETQGGNFDLSIGAIVSRLLQRVVRRRRTTELLEVARPRVPTAGRPDRSRAGRRQAKSPRPPGGDDSRARSAVPARSLGAALRRLVHLRQGPAAAPHLRHLRRGPVGRRLAGQVRRPARACSSISSVA